MASASPEIDRSIAPVPATPPPQNAPTSELARSPRQATEVMRITSMTPPPSSQIPSSHLDEAVATANLTLTPTTSRKNASKDLPSMQYIDSAGAEDLRRMVKSLVNDLTEARISNANARLQHHLLLLETNQAAERAEVEHALSRRQVDFLRVKQTKPEARHLHSASPAVQPASNSTDVFAQSSRDLEIERQNLEELCDKLKREKELQAEKIQSLSEHNSLLITRIRENREHFTRIRERSPIFATPREAYTTPRRRNYARYQDDTPTHGPFAALIAADQILSQETASVPSTPTKSHASHFKRGHNRGTHSLSAIQTPQSRDRPSTSEGFLGSQLLLSAPGSQLVNESAERERHDRDSTISISDNDNVERDGMTQSQASSLAADMLRKNPHTYESLRQSQDAEKTSNLLQSKLFGNVKKSGGHDSDRTKLKRQYGFSEAHATSPTKKLRPEDRDRIGLGIEA